MKSNFLLLPFAAFLVTALAAQDIDSVVIPAKTEIFVTLQRSVNTKSAYLGEKFYGQVSVPVTMNDKIIVPVGTTVLGHVEKSRKPGRVKGKAEITLKFDRVILPEGTTREIQAIVQSAENYPARQTARTEGTVVAEGSQGSDVMKGAAEGGVYGTSTGVIVGAVRGGILKGAGIGAAVGAAGGAIAGLLKRGKDVELRKGDSVIVQLTDSVRFVRPQVLPEGERLK